MSPVKIKYKYPVVSTDVVILTIKDEKLQVLLIKMKKKPYTDFWAAPGGLVNPDESVDDGAKRNLEEKTGVSNIYLEQLYTFGDVNRDPFGRVVSVSYFALVPSDKTRLVTTEEYAGVGWFPINRLPKLAYDHKDVVKMGVFRLKNKLTYSNVVYNLLPKEFTLTELQKTYELILDEKLDKRNFRKKIQSLGILTKTEKKQYGPNRPAVLYKFKKRKPEIVSML